MERKVHFILEPRSEGFRGGWEQTLIQRPTTLLRQSVGKSFKMGISGVIVGGKELRAETAQSALTVFLKLVIGMVTLCLSFSGTSSPFSKVAAAFYIPTGSVCFHFSMSSPALAVYHFHYSFPSVCVK